MTVVLEASTRIVAVVGGPEALLHPYPRVEAPAAGALLRTCWICECGVGAGAAEDVVVGRVIAEAVVLADVAFVGDAAGGVNGVGEHAGAVAGLPVVV